VVSSFIDVIGDVPCTLISCHLEFLCIYETSLLNISSFGSAGFIAMLATLGNRDVVRPWQWSFNIFIFQIQ